MVRNYSRTVSYKNEIEVRAVFTDELPDFYCCLNPGFACLIIKRDCCQLNKWLTDTTNEKNFDKYFRLL